MKQIDKQNRIAVLAHSGGMDSTCLLVRLIKEGYSHILCISFDYAQSHSVEILKAGQSFIHLSNNQQRSKLTREIINLRDVFSGSQSSLVSSSVVPQGHYEEENMKSTFVENRNAIFSAIIYSKALALSKQNNCDVDICLGIHSGDHAIYKDCTLEFRNQLELAFKIGNYGSERVSYYTPYIEGNKTTILEDCLENCEELGLDFDQILSRTITSYNPDELGRSSGKSGADIERLEAFINIGRKDPIKYQQPWEEVVIHAKSILENAK